MKIGQILFESQTRYGMRHLIEPIQASLQPEHSEGRLWCGVKSIWSWGGMVSIK